MSHKSDVCDELSSKWNVRATAQISRSPWIRHVETGFRARVKLGLRLSSYVLTHVCIQFVPTFTSSVPSNFSCFLPIPPRVVRLRFVDTAWKKRGPKIEVEGRTRRRQRIWM